MAFWDKMKIFSTLYEQLTEPVREQYHLTQLEFDILMFLYNNPQYNTANDIVKVRRLTKSHVSTSVASLEQKELIERSCAPLNRKSILLKLAPPAAEIISAGLAVQASYSEILLHGFSDAEQKQFHELFLRICENADAELNRRK